MTITDEMIMLGDRFYIKASVTLWNEDIVLASSVGYAREPESKKGMDASQITGTASSYARKYALNAMFLIDDTKDADTDAHHEQTNRLEKKAPSFDRQKEIDFITALVKSKTLTDSDKDQIKKDIGNAKSKDDFAVIYSIVEGM